jgi:hypothetical protein
MKEGSAVAVGRWPRETSKQTKTPAWKTTPTILLLFTYRTHQIKSLMLCMEVRTIFARVFVADYASTGHIVRALV